MSDSCGNAQTNNNSWTDDSMQSLHFAIKLIYLICSPESPSRAYAVKCVASISDGEFNVKHLRSGTARSPQKTSKNYFVLIESQISGSHAVSICWFSMQSNTLRTRSSHRTRAIQPMMISVWTVDVSGCSTNLNNGMKKKKKKRTSLISIIWSCLSTNTESMGSFSSRHTIHISIKTVTGSISSSLR